MASRSGITDPFSLGPIFEFDTIDVTDVTIKKYPFDSFSKEDFQSQFRFLGLPQAVLSRYVDANRLAMALKEYARKHIQSNYLPGDEDAFASASLTGSHVMSVLAPIFPPQVLEIPFHFILKQLPRADEHTSVLIDNDEAETETVIDIRSIVDSMTPPNCFGTRKQITGNGLALSPQRSPKTKIILSPNPSFTPLSQDSENADGDDLVWSINNFACELLMEFFEASQSSNNHALSNNLAHMLNSLLLQIKSLSSDFKDFDDKKRKKELFEVLRRCLIVKVCLIHCFLYCIFPLLTMCSLFLSIKGHGEDILASSPLPSGYLASAITTEWRKACERVYKRAVGKLKLKQGGNGHTTVITDPRCNGHITAENAFERPVRLPAAIKGAKLAGAGTEPNVSLTNTVQDAFVALAEEKVIPLAHQKSYVKRLKQTIASIPEDVTGVQLTDDSEGEGGDDTSKIIIIAIFISLQTLTTRSSLYCLVFRGISWFIYCGYCRGSRSASGC